MRNVFLCLLSACSVGLTGCGQSMCDGGDCGHDHGHVSFHVHPTEGPHHGKLVELGNDKYHAELLHDEVNETLTVYLLDGAAVNSVSSEATEAKINLSHDGHAEQFSLPASPQSIDPPGKSSRYVSQDAEVCEELDHVHGSAQLVVAIDGKQYRGRIEHEHDHDEAGHDHFDEMSEKSILIK